MHLLELAIHSGRYQWNDQLYRGRKERGCGSSVRIASPARRGSHGEYSKTVELCAESLATDEGYCRCSVCDPFYRWCGEHVARLHDFVSVGSLGAISRQPVGPRRQQFGHCGRIRSRMAPSPNSRGSVLYGSLDCRGRDRLGWKLEQHCDSKRALVRDFSNAHRNRELYSRRTMGAIPTIHFTDAVAKSQHPKFRYDSYASNLGAARDKYNKLRVLPFHVLRQRYEPAQ